MRGGKWDGPRNRRLKNQFFHIRKLFKLYKFDPKNARTNNSIQKLFSCFYLHHLGPLNKFKVKNIFFVCYNFSIFEKITKWTTKIPPQYKMCMHFDLDRFAPLIPANKEYK